MHSFILWNSQFQSLRLYLNLRSMIHVYAYTDSKHSATPMSIESKYYTSDANGKATRIAFLISNGECIGMRTTA